MKRRNDETDESLASDSKKTKLLEENDKNYFQTYSNLIIHEQMLKDSARTKTYKKAILENETDFKDKIVLDVGTGTGILAIFAVLAGAKKVFAVDASDIIDQAKLIILSNKLDKRITLIKGKIEEIEIPEKVDIIISEWMGLSFSKESMLPSVLYARDKWLKPNGKLFPCKANMYICPFKDPEFYKEKIEYWKNVEGIDFSSIIPFAKKNFLQNPIVEIIPSQNLLSFPVSFHSLDLKTVQLDEVLKGFSTYFECTCIFSDECHGFASWFDIIFEGSSNNFTLSTSPDQQDTHWCQTLFYFEEPIYVCQDQKISALLHVIPNSMNNRLLDIYFKNILGSGLTLFRPFK